MGRRDALRELRISAPRRRCLLADHWKPRHGNAGPGQLEIGSAGAPRPPVARPGANNSELVSSTHMSVDDTLAAVPHRGHVAMTNVWLAPFIRARAFMAEKGPSAARQERCSRNQAPSFGGHPLCFRFEPHRRRPTDRAIQDPVPAPPRPAGRCCAGRRCGAVREVEREATSSLIASDQEDRFRVSVSCRASRWGPCNCRPVARQSIYPQDVPFPSVPDRNAGKRRCHRWATVERLHSTAGLLRLQTLRVYLRSFSWHRAQITRDLQ
jgi:hypothetical protein